MKLVGLICSLLLLFFTTRVYSAGFTNSSQTTLLNAGDELTVNTTFSINAANGTSYYLRGLFYKDGTSSYCGYTWNGNSWYNGPYSVSNGWQQLFPITVMSSSWSGQLKAKIDTSDSNCQSSGNYFFKIQRYTLGGSTSIDDQNALPLTIIIPTSTPTPTPTPSPTPTDTPAPTPTKTPTPTPSTKPTTTLTPTLEPTENSKNKDSDSQILGASSESTPPEEGGETLVKGESTSNPITPTTFVIGGLIVIVLACGIMLFREWKKQKSQEL